MPYLPLTVFHVPYLPDSGLGGVGTLTVVSFLGRDASTQLQNPHAASERRGNDAKRFKDFTLKATALTVLYVPYLLDSGLGGGGTLTVVSFLGSDASSSITYRAKEVGSAHGSYFRVELEGA